QHHQAFLPKSGAGNRITPGSLDPLVTVCLRDGLRTPPQVGVAKQRRPPSATDGLRATVPKPPESAGRKLVDPGLQALQAGAQASDFVRPANKSVPRRVGCLRGE